MCALIPKASESAQTGLLQQNRKEMASVKMDFTETMEGKKPATMSPATLAALFVAWYAFNAGYNVYNGFIKSSYEYPHAIASLQLIIGVVVYAIPLYVLKLRKMPKISFSDFLRLLPVGTSFIDYFEIKINNSYLNFYHVS